MVVLARVHRPGIIIPVLMGAGYCWTSTMASLNTSVQIAVPAWVQARALGTYLMTFQGGLALGSMLWGSDRGGEEGVGSRCCARREGLSVSFRWSGGSVSCRRCAGAQRHPEVERRRRPAGAVSGGRRERRRSCRGRAGADLDENRIAAGVWSSRGLAQVRDVGCAAARCAGGIYRDATDPERLKERFIMESGWTTCGRGAGDLGGRQARQKV